MNTASFNVITKKEKPLLSSDQKTFNRLTKKIKDLYEQKKAVANDLDKSLQFYYENIQPTKMEVLALSVERLKIVYQFYKTTKTVSKADYVVLKEWLKVDVDSACQERDLSDQATVEVRKIFKDVHGVEYDDTYSQDFEDFKGRVQEELKEAGIDVDLSDISADGPQEEIVRKLYAKIGKKISEHKETQKEAPKTKKELEKELKKRAFEEMQTKGLKNIYKQLVRTLHPDLEPDLEQRIWKEELMKRLTFAYEKNDLYSLLTIEMEWMSRSNGQTALQNKEQIKIYNTLLKDQVKELEHSIDVIIMHPKYAPIQQFCYGTTSSFGLVLLKTQYGELKNMVQRLQKNVEMLKGPELELMMKVLIKEEKKMKKTTRKKCTSLNCNCDE